MEFNKLNKSGAVVFKKIFGNVGQIYDAGMSNSLKPTIDGGWVFGGGFFTQGSNAKAIIVKYNAVGDTEFVKLLSDTAWK